MRQMPQNFNPIKRFNDLLIVDSTRKGYKMYFNEKFYCISNVANFAKNRETSNDHLRFFPFK